MGMTYEQFWEKDCSLVIPYRKAYKIRQEEANRSAWLQGVYFLKAIQGTALFVQGFIPKGTKIEPFPTHPFEFENKKQTAQDRADDEAKREAEKVKRGMMAFIAAQQADKKQKELDALMKSDQPGKE